MYCSVEKSSRIMKSPRKISRALTYPGVEKSSVVDNCTECHKLQDGGLPKFRTPMVMLQKVGNKEHKLRVVLSIYSTNYDLYAVVSQDRNIIVKDCGYIKLKNCIVTMNKNNLSLEIMQKNYEELSLRFRVNKCEHLDEISKLLHLNTTSDDDMFMDIPSPLSCSPSSSYSLHPGLKNLRVPSSHATHRGSPRGSPLEKRKLSMPVLAEDEESEADEEAEEYSEDVDPGCESEE